MINQTRLVKTFLELVKIDSISSEEEKIAENLAKKLKKLGGEVKIDSYGNVIAKFKGKGEPIMLNAHMDTVEPGRGIKPIVDGNQIKSDGSTVLGGDCKAGLSIILEALESLKEEKLKHAPLEVVFTKEEETGLGGSINLDYKSLKSKKGVTFDGEREVERIDISSPTYVRVDISVKGKSAHAGVEPENGISAIQIASHIISKLKLGRLDSETTANIGMIKGGSVRNAVPESALIQGEIRSRNLRKLEAHMDHFKKIVKNIQDQFPESKIEAILEKEMDGYLLNEDHTMVIHAKKILLEMNLTPVLHHSGGLTDVNIFHTQGIEVVTVGIGDYLPHTTLEYVVISEMLKSAKFCEKAVKV